MTTEDIMTCDKFVLVKKSRTYSGGEVTAFPDESREATTLEEAKQKALSHPNPVGFDVYKYCPTGSGLQEPL